jgi:hypothetical protein
LKQAELTHTVQNAEEERANVHYHQEQDLGPHEPLLCLVTPCNKDAIVSWCAKLPGSQHKQSIVNQKSHNNPKSCHTESPNHDENLKVEVQEHSGSGNHRSAQVRVNRPKLPSTTFMVLGCVQLLTRAEVLPLAQILFVADRAEDQIDKPHNCENCSTHSQSYNRDQSKPMTEIAQAIVVESVESLAFCACISSIVVELVAMFNPRTAADLSTINHIGNWPSIIHLGAHGGLNTSERAMKRECATAWTFALVRSCTHPKTMRVVDASFGHLTQTCAPQRLLDPECSCISIFRFSS